MVIVGQFVSAEKSSKLTWETRINIAYGAAKGLEYLHRERIYGSMRPSNILVTHDYQPLVRLICCLLWVYLYG